MSPEQEKYLKHDTIADGIWPTMITPYNENGSIDYGSLGEMIEWFLDRAVAGLFALCQPSEIFFISLRDTLELSILRANVSRFNESRGLEVKQLMSVSRQFSLWYPKVLGS